MGMLFLVWGAQKVLKALPQGRKAMARCRWSWQRAPWLQLRLRCVPPPPPPPSVREAITAALSDPCWARWVHTLHRNIIPCQQVRWYHLVLCVTLVAMLIVHALERLDRRSARRDSLAHTAHRHRELLTAYLRQLARDEQVAFCYAESIEEVEGLLQRGVDPLVGNCGWQALRLACQDGHARVVQTLLERGVEPDDENIDPEGPTPLMLAVMEGHLPCVQQLSLHGASRHAREWDLAQGLRFVAGPVETIATALATHQQATSDAQQVLDFLVASREWCTALHHLELLSPRRVTVLLRCGADPHASVDTSDAAGATGTMSAVEGPGGAAAAAATVADEERRALGLTEGWEETFTFGAIAAAAAGAFAAVVGAAVAAVGPVAMGAAIAAGAAMTGAAGIKAAGAAVPLAAVFGVMMAVLGVVLPAAIAGVAIAVVRGMPAMEAEAAFSIASGAMRAAVVAAQVTLIVCTVTLARHKSRSAAGEAGAAEAVGAAEGAEATEGEEEAEEDQGAEGAGAAEAVERGAASAPSSAPTPYSRAMMLAVRGVAPISEEARGSCALVLLAGGPWSPDSHGLFPAAARARATTMLRLGHLMSSRFVGQEAAWTGIWLEIVMPHALDRGVSDHPTPAAAAASAAACMARDAARGWRLPWTRTHTAQHESKWHLAPAYHAMPPG